MTALSLLLLCAPQQPSTLEARLSLIEANSKSELGAAIITKNSKHYLRKGERFSLQSVMKLMVAMAALDQVDQGKLRRDQKFAFRQSDLSLFHQPLADRLGKRESIRVSIADCIDLTVTQSCSAAGDFLLRKMGGEKVVNAFLRKKGIVGLTVDRQERDLQTFVGGIAWRPEYVNSQKLDAALSRVSSTAKDAAYQRYMRDPRDTTSPEAMGLLLQKLVTGQLLSPDSTRYLMSVMERTQTGANRLRAGVPAGWKLGNKTGTSSTHRGLAWATNDVGYVRSASGEWVIVVALLRNSRLKADERDNVLKQVCEAAFAHRSEW